MYHLIGTSKIFNFLQSICRVTVNICIGPADPVNMFRYEVVHAYMHAILHYGITPWHQFQSVVYRFRKVLYRLSHQSGNSFGMLGVSEKGAYHDFNAVFHGKYDD